MNFMKRGIQSLWAKKGRSVMLIAVFSAILIFVLSGLTIRSGAIAATETAQKSVGATVTLQANREAAFKRDRGDGSETESGRPDPGSFEMPAISLSDAQSIAALNGIASYNFEASTSADAGTGIEPISSTEDNTTSETEVTSDNQMMGGGGMMGGPGDQMPGSAGGMSQGDFQITGVAESEVYTSFSGGTAVLIEGEAITAEDEGTNHILIEQTLADANELTVGDTFTILAADDQEVEVTIKGIYETTDVGTSMGMMFNFLNPVNTLISSYTFTNTLKGNSEPTLDSATYTLRDPEKMSAFVTEAEALIDTDTYSLQTNDQMYQSMLQPLNNVASFAQNIIILVAAAGVIILTLIVMMSIRERKYEIGVLLSLGESRTKVVFQFFTEILVCMVIALGIAAASGNTVGNLVGEQLLAQQTTTENASPNGIPDRQMQGGPGDGAMQPPDGGGNRGGGFQPFGQSEEVAELNITVKPQEIGLLALLGLGISFVSILLASIGILRLNPKKILIS